MALTLIYRMFATLVSWMVLRGRPGRAKEIEILVLRHQLAILQRRTPRPRLRWSDRAVVAALTLWVPGTRPTTVTCGFRHPPRLGMIAWWRSD